MLAVVAAAILVGSLVPPPSGGPGGARWIALDGIVHVVAYAVLALAVAAARTDPGAGTSGSARRAVEAVAVAVAYGAAIELLQAPLPWRRFGVDDLMANAAGAALAAVLIVGGARLRPAAGGGPD